MTRRHVKTARSSSAMASSDGHDISRIVESRSTTWTLPRFPIFFGGARRSPLFHLTWVRRGTLWITRLSAQLKLHRTAVVFREEPRSTRDRGHNQPRSWPHLRRNHSHDHRSDRGHQFHPTTLSNGQKFWAKFLFKKPCILPLKINF